MTELVSIIVPTYNRGHLIGETIQSVVNQSYTNWELIIVDDGSTDDTKKRVEEFRDQRIRYYCIEHSGIIGAVRNFGMKNAIGEFVAFLDSDDLWLPNKLEYQLSLLEKNPQAAFVFGHGEQFGNATTPPPDLEKLFIGDVFHPFLIEERFIFYVPTLLFKKEILSKISAFDESFYYSGDIDFFLRLAYAVEGVFSNDIVIRVRKQERSHSLNNEPSAYDEYQVMLKNHLQESRLTSKQFARLAFRHHYKLGLIYLQSGNSKRARKEFQNYIRLNPLSWKGWIRLTQSLLFNK